MTDKVTRLLNLTWRTKETEMPKRKEPILHKLELTDYQMWMLIWACDRSAAEFGESGGKPSMEDDMLALMRALIVEREAAGISSVQED